MAHGAPDWWSSSKVDVFQQSLSYLTQIAYLGVTDFTETVVEDLSGQILAMKVEGKGLIMGGIIEVTQSTNLLVNKVQVEIDGAVTMAYTFEDFLTKNITLPGTWLLYGIKCDTVNNKGLIGITPNLRFDSYFQINIATPSGETTDWIIRLMAGVY